MKKLTNDDFDMLSEEVSRQIGLTGDEDDITGSFASMTLNIVITTLKLYQEKIDA